MLIIDNLLNLLNNEGNKEIDKYDIYLDLIEKGLYYVNIEESDNYIEVKIPKKYILKSIFINM